MQIQEFNFCIFYVDIEDIKLSSKMQAYNSQKSDQIKTGRKQKSQLKERGNCTGLNFTFIYYINIHQSTVNYELT